MVKTLQFKHQKFFLGTRTAAEILNVAQWVSERKQLLADEEIDNILQSVQDVLLESAHVDTFMQYLTLSHRLPVLLVGTAYSTAFFTALHREMAADKPVTESTVQSLLPNFADYVFEDLQQFDYVVMPVQRIGHTADDPGHFVRTKTYIVIVVAKFSILPSTTSTAARFISGTVCSLLKPSWTLLSSLS